MTRTRILLRKLITLTKCTASHINQPRNPDSWTLRLVVSGSAEGLKLLAKHGLKEAPDLMVLPYVRRDGFRWWQACLGAFPSRSEAMKAIANLSPPLRKALSDPLPLKLDRLPGDPPKS